MYFRNLLLALLTLSLTSMAFANFKSKTDGEFITISGKVTDVSADWFKLKANGRSILVEMDDGDHDADGYKLVKGDDVVVSGVIDHDFLEKKKIEAGSVYVKSLNTYFYASSIDEEGAPYLSPTYIGIATLPENTMVELRGKVTNINVRKFTLDTGLRKITVDTDTLLYNPLDDVGFTKVKKGDRVMVSGVVDDNFFGKREVNASSILKF